MVVIIEEFDQYFVCTPLAYSTTYMQRGIDLDKVFWYDGMILFQTLSAILFKPATDVAHL